MATIPSQQTQSKFFALTSNSNQGWNHISIAHLQHPAGECNSIAEHEHTICLSLAKKPVHLLQKQGGKTYTGMYSKGDLTITPAKTQFLARWDGDDQILQIRLCQQFMRKVAHETLLTNSDQLELTPQFRTRNPQIEAIAMMLLTELQQQHCNSQLYIDSLANIFAVNLLRQYATTKPQLPSYEGGLPQTQLQQILDYIDSYLDQDIKLKDLAQLLDMSQFHFTRLFKQSIGISPYQYLLGQRVERAKQLLKQTDYLIVDIALECGFNSHSHLTKQFRQLTGMTPKAYRAS
ncbi:MAG TPA: AraC family transcriptional regulator [Cyanothece sp. UBA12306]|nr:AraC family transcriptional regulator [Cyanothece sp. UBA12306]